MVPQMQLCFIIMVRNQTASLGGGGSGEMPAGTHSIMFIHTNEKWDGSPWQLTML